MGGSKIQYYNKKDNNKRIIGKYKKIISRHNKKGNFNFNFIERLEECGGGFNRKPGGGPGRGPGKKPDKRPNRGPG